MGRNQIEIICGQNEGLKLHDVVGLERQYGDGEQYLYRQPSGRPASALTTSSNITKKRQKLASFGSTVTEYTIHYDEITAFCCRIKGFKARSLKSLSGRTND